MTSETIFTLVMQIASLFAVACGIFLISSWLICGTFLAHRRYAGGLYYRLKNSLLFFYALGAVAASIVVTIWLSMPQSLGLAFVFKHCHNSNCATHVPALLDHTALNLLYAFFAIGMITVCFIIIKTHQKRLDERLNSLLRLSNDTNASQDFLQQTAVINVPEPVLLNVGMLTPKLLLSSQLTASLKIEDVKILLAYEYAKAKQFENIKIKLVQIACLFWPASIRRILVSDLQVIIRERAFKEICQLFGHPKTTIPPSILNKLTSDLKQFVVNMQNYKDPLSQSAYATNDDKKITPTAFILSLLYFAGLVIVTSNFTHFLFELIG
jgi:hypothetical protein